MTDGCLGRMVSWLATHTKLYLNSSSHHCPSTKQGTLYTSVHRARALCYAEGLHAELDFLQSAVSDNGCSQKEIWHVFNPPARTANPSRKPTLVAYLLYVQMTYRRVSRLLARRNTGSVCLLAGNISSYLHPVKDYLGPKTVGLCRVLCEYGRIYVGHTD